MKTIRFKLSTKIAIFTFILSFLGILSLSIISYNQAKFIFNNNLTNTLKFETQKTKNYIEQSISETKKDILFLSNSEAIGGILRTTKNKYNFDEQENIHLTSWNIRLEKLFKFIMKQNESYFQIRFIGVKNDGKELIRIENKNKEIVKIKEKNLQSKINTNYYKNTIKLKPQEIFMSNINLNREHGFISTPYIPTIRVSTPIYNDDEIYGFIIININVNKLFRFDKFKDNKNIDTYISNDDGYYIYNKDYNKLFGFEFGKDIKIQKDFNIRNLENSKTYYDNHLNEAISLDCINLNKTNKEHQLHMHIYQIANSKFYEKDFEEFRNIILFYTVLISFVIALLSSFLTKYLTNPISKLSNATKEITDGKIISFKDLDIHSKDEIEELARSFYFMLRSLNKAKKELELSANNLEEEVQNKTAELSQLNIQLEEKITEAIDDIRQKDDALAQQSKLASMGEMIGAIAHQWRQPLNALGIQIQSLKYSYKNNEIDEEFLNTFISKNKTTIQFMSDTIDDFRNFFRVDKQKDNFKVKQTIQSVISMQEAQLQSHSIEIEIIGEEFEYYGLKSEFQQVILNIINNAKDAFEENNIQNAKIIIKIDNTKKSITIHDNAGGIPNDVIKRIFEPYFTTKEQGKGTGIGLYMSKMIIVDNMNSSLDVKNVNNGALFTIELMDDKDE